MSIWQQIVTIAAVVLGTMTTRFLPFFIFANGRPIPPLIQELGRLLPTAVFGLLVVYCLKDVSLLSSTHGWPELVASAIVIVVHLWRSHLFLSLVVGTAAYMWFVY